jgi:hypothetical protein
MRVGVPGAGRATQAAARVVRDPRVAGAADGASTTALQASLNGEDASFEDIAESARAGAVSAGVGDLVGKYGSNALPNRGKGLTKEQVGETLSIAKSIASGDGRPWGRTIPEFNAILPKVKGPARQVDVPLSRTYTKADHVTHKAIAVESKFGPYARLTDPQGLARLELPAGHYRVDHWLPSDAGRIVSALFAAPGSHWEGGEGEWR